MASRRRDFTSTQEELDAWINQAISAYVADVTEVGKPRLVAIGAQPGAGKSGLSRSIVSQFKAVAEKPHHSDIDNLREGHPHKSEILTQHLPDFASLTNEDAYAVQYRLLEIARDIPAHVVYEGTLRDVDGIGNMVSDFRRHGYAFDFHGLIVEAHWSILGIHERFEKSIARDRTPRMVSVGYHDFVYDQLPQSFNQIVQALNPDVAMLYNSHQSVIWEYGRSSDALLEAIERERGRTYTKEEMDRFEERWNMTMSLHHQRTALPSEGDEYKTGLAKSFEDAVLFLQRQRLHIHSVPTTGKDKRHP